MKCEYIIQLAREAGFSVGIGSPVLPKLTTLVLLAATHEQEAMFARIRPTLVEAEERGAASEREACAQLCEGMHNEDGPEDYAYAIRSRNQGGLSKNIPPPNQWQPIETAPRDGSVFVAAAFHDGYEPLYEIGRYDPVSVKRYESVGNGLFRELDVQLRTFTMDNEQQMTHWAPLFPALTTTAKASGSGE